jgi:hypothetical protein
MFADTYPHFFSFQLDKILLNSPQVSKKDRRARQEQAKMPRIFSAIGKAASFTIRGAAVTFGSTVFSCLAAVHIERGANRMIYKYYPHKFANVDAANGITQEELDFVKFIYGGNIVVAADGETDDSSSKSSSTSTIDAEILYRYDSYDDSSVVNRFAYNEPTHAYNEPTQESMASKATETKISKEQDQEKSTVNKFWTEGEDAAAKALSILPVMLPRQEILACSMTA